MEILSPAGSPEALKAAVMCGADAVYMGGMGFNARANARNFSEQEITESIRYCHERGVAVYATLNTLVSDREIKGALAAAEFFTAAGVDAFIVQDMGLIKCLKMSLGGAVPLHASTQMTVCSADGAAQMLEMGFRRVVLSRELSAKDIEHIVKTVPIETEVFVHGALCMCYSGQCYMSSVIGGRSGNRGECAQPCRLPYRNGYALSLKDNCLLEYVGELERMGVTSLKIEGRMKGAEYVGAVTDAYVRAKNGEEYSEDKKEYLASVFSRDGFTDGYYTDRTGKNMFGVRRENETSARFELPTAEYKRFGIDLTLTADVDYRVRCTASTGDGFVAETSVEGQHAQSRVTDGAQIRDAFAKLGGTPYELKNIECHLPDDIFIPVSLMNAARRELVTSLTTMRSLKRQAMTPRVPDTAKKSEPVRTVRAQFLFVEQMPENVGALEKIWLPLEHINSNSVLRTIDRYGEKIGLTVPTVVHDSEYALLDKYLSCAADAGVKDMLCENIGLVRHCMEKGFTVHGGCGLNVCNSVARDEYESMGVESLMTSFELNMRQTVDIADGRCGIFAYGRLPFMTMRNCIKGDGKGCSLKNKPWFLTDRMGKQFLATCAFGCRNRLYNADTLWLADKPLDGAGFLQLVFTDEAKDTVRKVIDAYTGGGDFVPEKITRGLYYR